MKLLIIEEKFLSTVSKPDELLPNNLIIKIN